MFLHKLFLFSVSILCHFEHREKSRAGIWPDTFEGSLSALGMTSSEGVTEPDETMLLVCVVMEFFVLEVNGFWLCHPETKFDARRG